MKILPMILLTALAAAIASFAAVRMTSKPDTRASTSTASADEVARLTASVASLQEKQTEIAQTLADLRAELVASERGQARVPLGDIEAAVARALEARTGAAPAATAALPEKAAAPKTKPQGYLARLTAQDVSWDEAQKIWQEAAADGELDQVVALFEEFARTHADDAHAQVELGHAYLQKVFQAGGGPEAGKWAIRADQAYDGALKIDDHNWEARFSKAMSLSHWPAVFGKQHDAIQNFETLVAQQAGQTQRPEFAQTHFLLGNMYQQIGEKDKALAAWQNGLALFPDNAALAAQIAGAQGH